MLGQIRLMFLTSSGPHMSGMMTSETTTSKQGLAAFTISNA